MAQPDVVLLNNANGKQFRFRAVAPFENQKNQPSVDIPLIGTSAANRVIFRFTGQAQNISFTFAIFDDGEDITGSQARGIITVPQQIQYLMDEIFTAEVSTTWTLVEGTNLASPISGTIEDIKISSPAGAGTVRTGTLIFKRGRIGAV